MDKKPFIVILTINFLLFTFLPTTYSTQVLTYKLISSIEEGFAEEEHYLTLFNNASCQLNHFSISLPRDVEMVYVKDVYSNLNFKIERNEKAKLTINFSIPIKPREARLVMLKYKTQERVKARGNFNEYLLVFMPKQDIENFELILKLPRNSELYSPKDFEVVVPKANLSVLEGRPVLKWKTSIQANHPQIFLVRFRGKPNFNYFVLLSLLILTIALVLTWKFGRKVWKTYQRMRRLSMLKILNERERKVLEEIIKKEGITQLELMHKLGFSKASLSKILSKLELRGLVKKKKWGKVNKLYPGEKL
ncbi:MAG: winged helix-turn-helix transcriptional regulator [Candidatus Aenigmarchaeota archaeon]|nr:winged helix-turn-helix transcriptional regulator [Candidatus Aenigmarchaeota archaeon]